MRRTAAYVCRSCGHEVLKWLGRCPGCGEWNTLEAAPAASSASRGVGRAARRVHGAPAAPDGAAPLHRALSLSEAESDRVDRRPVGWAEFDRVVGGGLVPGSIILLGGEPGIGKSTLLLQVSARYATRYGRVLYVSGEESVQQLALRAGRLGLAAADVWVVGETEPEAALAALPDQLPSLIVVDSVQAMRSEAEAAAAGSVSQVRTVAAFWQQVAKATQTTVILVGHVTKQGHLAGPKVLEHLVDVVLEFEGERQLPYRLLRAMKNRYGPTNECGVFEMGDGGLVEVTNPSAAFLSERPAGSPGSAVVACLEGSRPILVEVQALTGPSPFGGTPRRQVSGAYRERVFIVLAVLERRVGFPLVNADVYVNVAGGARVDEPALDLGIALAVASSLTDRPVDAATAVFGEVGLAGEVRSVSQPLLRAREASRLGFSRLVVPQGVVGRLAGVPGVEVRGAAQVRQALGFGLVAGAREPAVGEVGN